MNKVARCGSVPEGPARRCKRTFAGWMRARIRPLSVIRHWLTGDRFLERSGPERTVEHPGGRDTATLAPSESGGAGFSFTGIRVPCSFPRHPLDRTFRADKSEAPGRGRGASGCAESAHESRTEGWGTRPGGERVVRAQEQCSPCRTRRSQCLPRRALIPATYGRRS